MRFFTRLVLRSEWHIFSRTIVSCHSDVPARNFITFLQILSFRMDMRNLMRNRRLTGDSSSLTVVRMTCIFKGGSPLSFQARPVARRGISSFLLVTVAIVLSLGGRFFKAKPFRMTLMSSRTKLRDLMQNVLLGMRFFTSLTLHSEWHFCHLQQTIRLRAVKHIKVSIKNS